MHELLRKIKLMENGYVKTEHPQAALAAITFYHPKHNSLPSHLLSDLTEAIKEAGQQEAIQVIVIKSAGNRTFCAGASFDELLAIQDLEAGKKFFSGFANVINACRTCPKLIIGRVQGKAVGGGVGIAAAVDYCLATKYAAVKLSELNIGIGPFVIEPAVKRKIGLSAFSQLAINANTFQSAAWAKDKGLYVNILEDTEQLDEAVDHLTNYLLSTNPEAQRLMKKTFWKGTDHWSDLLYERAAMSGKLVLSDYTKKALRKIPI
ncbi:MAG: enoyl-CoA hydratase/isomerase family protein [Bacteroidota bacterium]